MGATLTACEAPPQSAADLSYSGPPSKLWSAEDFPKLAALGLEQSAAELARYFQDNNYPDLESVRGDTLSERQASQRLLIENYTAYFVTRGIDLAVLEKHAKPVETALQPADRLLNGPVRFADMLAFSEKTVRAKVGEAVPGAPVIWSGPSAYYLKIEPATTGGTGSSPAPLIIRGTIFSHDVPLYEGRDCVFFLSPVLTDLNKRGGASDRERYFPQYMVEQSFPPYCRNDDGGFTRSSPLFGADTVSQQDMLTLMAVRTEMNE